jgi:hypothetical protein
MQSVHHVSQQVLAVVVAVSLISSLALPRREQPRSRATRLRSHRHLGSCRVYRILAAEKLLVSPRLRLR